MQSVTACMDGTEWVERYYWYGARWDMVSLLVRLRAAVESTVMAAVESVVMGCRGSTGLLLDCVSFEMSFRWAARVICYRCAGDVGTRTPSACRESGGAFPPAEGSTVPSLCTSALRSVPISPTKPITTLVEAPQAGQQASGVPTRSS